LSSAILGISAYYHDSAAALLLGDRIIAAAQEERFTRKKHDAGFPFHSIRYALQQAQLELADIDTVIFYEKPYLKFERLLETYHAFAPAGIQSFLASVPSFLRDKLFLNRIIKLELKKLGNFKARILFSEHHLSHSASAFFPSPFNEAAILNIDGVGEWTSTSIGVGHGNKIEILKELHFPHSLGMLYSSFTFYLGFKVNSGEYKVMGLSPYSSRNSSNVKNYKTLIVNNLIDIREDGSFLLNMHYFRYTTALQMTADAKWESLFGIKRRLPEDPLMQEHADLALAVQEVAEDILIKLARTTHDLTGSHNLVMAGGVALNCVANQKIKEQNIFKNIWVQPAAGDAGGALGAAFAAYYIEKNKAREIQESDGQMKNAYLGPDFSEEHIRYTLEVNNIIYEYVSSEEALLANVAEYLSEQNIVGWFQGRMEFGPRALGNRSILADPRSAIMQQKLNKKIKFREGFRPFAPCVLEEFADEYFEIDVSSPYMMFTAFLREQYRTVLPDNFLSLEFSERLDCKRSEFPAVTHLDYTARIQTVNKTDNLLLYKLLNCFREKTGCPMLVNTSFNVRGEPIVCTPLDAIRCFLNTGIDYLVIGNFIIDKKNNSQSPAGNIKLYSFEND
jgi:carbamoyltransferase